MTEDIIYSPSSPDELTEESRSKLATAQDSATEMLASAAGYIKAHPWTAAAGVATVLGAAVLAFAPRSKPKPLDIARGWLDEAYGKLPSRKQVDSVAESVGLTAFLRDAGRKLHLVS